MAPGAGFEPARGRINSAVPFQLGYPGRTLVGNLGVEPSDLCVPGAADFRLPRSRTSTFQELVGPSGLEPESQASETCALSSWTMDRSGTGVGNRTRIPGLGNRRSVQLNYARSGWGGRRKSNPRGRFHRPPPNHSATATLGARSTSRTCLSSFSDWCLDRNGLPGEFGGRGGS